MSDQIITVNRIPSPTYRWLKMNYSRTDSFSGVSSDALFDVPSYCTIKAEEYTLGGITTGTGEELDQIFLSSGVLKRVITIPDDCREDVPVRIDITASGSDNGLLPVEFYCGENTDATVIVRIMSEDDTYSRQAFQTRLHIGANSKITLVTVCECRGREVFCDIGAEVSDKAEFKLTQLFLSGNKIFSGCRCALSGERSLMNTDIAYHTADESLLDMNYIADHIGKRTESAINVSGVLKDKAKKLFRGTIDFKKGAKGAVGNEKEDVLLFDDAVENKTIPVILCAEEDVEGNHGATIGKLPEELLFYMGSRGMDTAEIYDMMARARIESVCKLIEDEATREYIGGLDIFGGVK